MRENESENGKEKEKEKDREREDSFKVFDLIYQLIVGLLNFPPLVALLPGLSLVHAHLVSAGRPFVQLLLGQQHQLCLRKGPEV